MRSVSEADDSYAGAQAQCQSCVIEAACRIRIAAQVYGPGHPRFPREWVIGPRGASCTDYQPPRLVGTGRIEDAAQPELFPS
jgi:hypothetical protein